MYYGIVQVVNSFVFSQIGSFGLAFKRKILKEYLTLNEAKWAKSPLSIYLNSVLHKRHHLEGLGNKYKDLYKYIPQILEMIPFVWD